MSGDVYTLEATRASEELVCAAARNDMSTEPPRSLRGESFISLMSNVEVDPDEAESVLGDLSGDPSEWHPALHENKMGRVRERSLLKHLMNSGHWGPFEHPQATLVLEDVTRVAMAQITRHRHFTFDIMSLRYCDVSDDGIEDRFEIPPEVQDDSTVSRGGVHDVDEEAENTMKAAYADAIRHYQRLMDQGVPQEEARKVLPMGTKVNIVMSGNARAWMHLLNIRGKANVQGEARRLAEGIFEEMKEWMPFTFRYYDENTLPLQLNP